jgi:hypothetical protein
MGRVLVIEINPQDQRVHPARREVFIDELNEAVHLRSGRRGDAKATHGKAFVETVVSLETVARG